MKKVLQTCLLFFLLVSCSPEELFIDVKPAEEKLAISSQYLPGGILLVTVTRTFSALVTNKTENIQDEELSNLLVDKARVTVNVGETIDTLAQLGDNSGIYIGIFDSLKPGDLVNLYVYDSLTEDSVFASTVVLPQVSLENVSVEKLIEGDTTSILSYSFTEPEEDNWYILHVYGLDSLPTVFSDSLIFDLADQSLLITSELISDAVFDSSYVNRHIELPFYNSPDTLAFMLTNISEGYFRFLDARQRTGGLITSATGEPINHPSNVIHGYGYFNMHVPHVKLGYRE